MASRYFPEERVQRAQMQRATVLRSQYEQFKQQDNTLLATRVSSLGSQVPWMAPDAALSLGQGGVDGNDPIIDQLATSAAKAKAKKKGFGWHSIGDMVRSGGPNGMIARKLGLGGAMDATGRAVGDAASTVARNVGGATGKVVKPTVRTGLTAASAPFEELQGLFRNVVTGDFKEAGQQLGAASQVGFAIPTVIGDKIGEETIGALGIDMRPQWYKDLLDKYHGAVFGNSQSTAGVALNQLSDDQNVDLGKGFFPSGATKTAQTQRARDAGSIDGHAITPGRWLANTVVEPGTKPYNIMSGVVDGATSWFLDPVNQVGKFAKAGRDAKSFVSDADALRASKEDAGLIDARTKDIIPQKVEAWFATPHGANTVQKMADSNFIELRSRLGKQVDTDTLVALADAKDPTQVMDVLRPRLGLTMLDAPSMQGGKLSEAGRNLNEAIIKRRPKLERFSYDTPGQRVDLDDADDAVDQIDKIAVNVLLPRELREKRMEEMARATGRQGRNAVLWQTMDDVAAHVGAEHGLDKTEAHKLTRMFRNQFEDTKKYFTNASGQSMPVPGVTIDGSELPTATPHLYSELVGRFSPLPDARELREATSTLARVHRSGAVDATEQIAEGLASRWKALQIIRPAYTVRVQGEAQLRLAAKGYSSVFSHPADAFAYITGRRGSTSFTGKDIKTESDLAADVDEFAASLAKTADRAIRSPRGLQHTKVNIAADDAAMQDQYLDAWADELLLLRSDEATRRVVGDWDDAQVPAGAMTGDNIAQAKEWFWSGEGKAIREDFATAPGRERYANDRAIADEYIDSLLNRVEIKTRGNPELMKALATGLTPEGVPLRHGMRATPQFKQLLARLHADGSRPASVVGDFQPPGDTSNPLDRFIDGAFNYIASRPENYMTREPMWKQAYWRRGEKLMPFLSPEAQAEMIGNAQKANLPKSQIAKLNRMKALGARDLTIDDAHMIASQYAKKEVTGLVFDLAKRNQFFDMYRLMVPFGDAWKEVGTTWAKLSVENPSVPYRGATLIEAARGADVDGDGQGFFYKDKQTGQEMFAYPFSKELNSMLGVDNVAWKSPVQGLNIFGTVLPGMGPAITVPAGAFLPDIPETEDVRKIIFPMGEPEREGGFAESFLPSWFQKIRQGTGLFGRPDERAYNIAVSDLMSQMVAEGDYDPSSQEGMNQLEAEARKRARNLYIIRGAAQATAPSAPTPEFYLNANGETILMDSLVREYHEMGKDKAAGGYGTANKRFIEKFGPDSLLAIVPRSTGEFGATTEASKFRKNNQELAEAFPEVFGYFAPQGGSKLDMAEFNRQLKSGERDALSPDEVLQRLNAMKGRLVYDQIAKQVEGRTDTAARQWKADVRQALMREYKGYGVSTFDPYERDRTIGQLKSALEKDKLANTETGKALGIYLGARDQALVRARANGTVGLAGNKNAALRSWLYEVGEAAKRENPDFGDVWDSVLSSEVETPDG